MTADQIRAARALIGWSQPDLAREAGVSATTIKNIETGRVEPRRAIAAAIRNAFDKASVAFTQTGVEKKN